MRKLDVETLAAIGRMTVAAAELEHVLAWVGADQAGGDAEAVFRQAGEPLRAARGFAQLAPPDGRERFVAMVEAAGTQLAVAQRVLRGLWRETGAAAGAAVFDEVAVRLGQCAEELREYLGASV